MARKSRWQQFADNFNSVYGAFSSAAQDWESGDIMAEKPEELLDEETGATYWKYGGKRYDKQITPDQLSGLQYNRLADMKSKWGDHAGAMDMRTKYQTLQEKIRANKLGEATFAADQMKPFNDNLLTLSRVGLNDADRKLKVQELARLAQILPHELQGLALDNAKKILGNEAKQIENYIQDASKDAQVNAFSLKNDQTASQTALNNANAGLTASRTISNNLDNQFTKATMDSRIDSTNTANRADIGTNEQVIAGNEAWKNYTSDYKSGLYEGDPLKAAQGFADYMMGVNPVLGQEILKKYTQAKSATDSSTRANELEAITHTTMEYQAKAKAAFSKDGLAGLKKVIDDENGLDFGVEIRENKNKDGKVESYSFVEVDKEGNVTREWANAADKKQLGLAVMQGTQPTVLLPFVMDQADVNLKKAQTMYNLAKAKSEGLSKSLTKDQWAISRFAKNPRDPFAAAILLGDGYSMDDIDRMVTDSNLTNALGNAEGSSGGPDTNTDTGDSTPSNKKEPVNNAGSSGAEGIEQIDLEASLNKQKQQKTKAKLQVSLRVQKIVRDLAKDLVPWTLDSNLPAKDYRAQKARDEARDWLSNNLSYFLEHPKELAELEKDPQGWYNNYKANQEEEQKKGLKK